MNEAKQAHVGHFRLWAVRCFLTCDSPRLRSAARSLVSAAIWTRWPPDSHPIEPLNENRSVVFWGSFFGERGICRRKFSVAPETLKFKPYCLVALFPKVRLTRGKSS